MRETNGLKTNASKRFIPIHTKLIDELGLFRLSVKPSEKKGSDRLFPELKKQSQPVFSLCITLV